MRRGNFRALKVRVKKKLLFTLIENDKSNPIFKTFFSENKNFWKV